MNRFFSNLNFSLGFGLSVVVVVLAMISYIWTPYPPNAMNASHRLEAPSLDHWLGTDQYGRDTLSRVMKGAVNSIIVGLVTVAMGMSVGVVLGLLAAYCSQHPHQQLHAAARCYPRAAAAANACPHLASRADSAERGYLRGSLQRAIP